MCFVTLLPVETIDEALFIVFLYAKYLSYNISKRMVSELSF